MCPMKGSHGVYLLSAASNQIKADSWGILEFEIASKALINAIDKK